MTPKSHPPRSPWPFNSERPVHPRGQAIVLVIAVLAAVVILASISTFGAH
jgi:hypothetical protein